MNLNYLIGPACLLLGFLIALYVKDSARSIAKIEFHEQIGAAFAVFKVDLLAAMEGKYQTIPMCQVLMTASAQRADAHEKQESKDHIRLDQQDRHMEYIDKREGRNDEREDAREAKREARDDKREARDDERRRGA
jgi:hypothetical protein